MPSIERKGWEQIELVNERGKSKRMIERSRADRSLTSDTRRGVGAAAAVTTTTCPRHGFGGEGAGERGRPVPIRAALESNKAGGAIDHGRLIVRVQSL
jgi:hypothetical protein